MGTVDEPAVRLVRSLRDRPAGAPMSAEICSTKHLSGPFDVPGRTCGEVAVALVTYGCVHEHFITAPKCGQCATGAGVWYCTLCYDDDGHWCNLRVLESVVLS